MPSHENGKRPASRKPSRMRASIIPQEIDAELDELALNRPRRRHVAVAAGDPEEDAPPPLAVCRRFCLAAFILTIGGTGYGLMLASAFEGSLPNSGGMLMGTEAMPPPHIQLPLPKGPPVPSSPPLPFGPPPLWPPLPPPPPHYPPPSRPPSPPPSSPPYPPPLLPPPPSQPPSAPVFWISLNVSNPRTPHIQATNDNGVRVIGRYVNYSLGIAFDHPGVRITAHVTGTTRITALLSQAGYNGPDVSNNTVIDVGSAQRFMVMINGVAAGGRHALFNTSGWARREIREVTLATGLKRKDVHKVELVKISEAQFGWSGGPNYVTLHGFDGDTPRSQSKPPPISIVQPSTEPDPISDRRLVFLGDSITAGWCNLYVPPPLAHTTQRASLHRLHAHRTSPPSRAGQPL